jgi:8-oxo-dGTP pyrophosphatase MutT (NUDIX family)
MSEDDAEALDVTQIAALPIRWDDKGQLRILMVTSRGTGRWVMPKGWLMDGKKPWHAAEIEALEEAGAIGCIGREALGEYDYMKTLDDGTSIPVRVRLYPMIVERLKKRWKERNDRTRRWFSVRNAAKRVDEPELRAMLLSLAEKPRKEPAIKKLLLRAS